jgi:hypothetical protein
MGWLALAGLPTGDPARPIESDVSTVLAEVDKVLHVDAASPWLAHLELQVSRDPALQVRLLQYHALLLHRHAVPVATTVVLLRPQAHSPEITGRFVQRGPTGAVSVTFRYGVVRLWERPVDEIMRCGIGVLPLAPLSDVEPSRLPAIIDQLDERFRREAPSPSATDELWAATLLLMGMRYHPDKARYLLRGVTRLRESSTYQMILAEGREAGEVSGRVQEARQILLRLGTMRFGAPPGVVASRLDSIDDLPTLDRLVDALLPATSWDDLMARADG